MKIPLIRPYVTSDAIDRIGKVIESGFMAEGPVTAEFEARTAEYLGVEHSIAVDSCTTGLEMALRCLGIGPGDEVVVPDYTFPATGLAVLATGATPVIVDVDAKAMLVNMEAMEAAITSATKAIMPISLFGAALNYDELAQMKERHGVYVVEDAACAFGTEYKGTKVGSLADITVFSLHPRKFITTARGGLITTQNEEWARWMRSFKCFGKNGKATRVETVFDQMGGNAMMPDVLSAIGLSQMDMVDDMLSRRRELAARYISMLDGVEGVEMPLVVADSEHSFQSFCIFVDDRDRVMKSMREQGIEVQIGTYALHLHPFFSENKQVRVAGDMAGSLYAFEHCLTLPLYHEMTTVEQDEVVERLAASLAA